MAMNLLKRIAIWTAAAILALLVIAAIVLPRVINTEAVKTAVERTISRDLGGTLTYDRVLLSILPRPRIVLQKPKIEIPRKVSAVMDSLDIYPAIFPLLTGTLRIHDVHLGEPEVTLLVQEGQAAARQRKKPAPSSGPSAEDVLAVAAKHMPGIRISIEQGGLTVMRQSEQVLTVRKIEASVVFLPAQAGAGSTTPPADRSFHISGSASCSVDSPDLPLGPLTLTVERFEALPRTFSFSGARARLLDLSISLSGSINDYLSDTRKADVSLSGTAGPNVLLWRRDNASLSPQFTLRSPLSLSDTRVRWEQSGALHAAGHAVVKEGPSIDFDVRRSSGAVSLKRLAIRDKESQALFTAELSDRVMDASFSGNLTLHTLNSLLEQQRFRFGWIKGDLKARLPLDHLAGASAEGMLEGEQLVVPWRKQVPLIISRLSVTVHGRDLALDPLAISLGGSTAVLSGAVAAHDDGLVLDLDLTSREVAWDDLRELFLSKDDKAGVEEGRGDGLAKPKEQPFLVRGTLGVNVDALRGKRYVFQPVRGTITIDRDVTRYDIRETAVCGIGVAGTVVVSRGTSDLSLNASAKERDLAPSLTCLAGEDQRISGKFDLTGSIAGSGPNDRLFQSLAGKVAVAAKNGRVYNDVIVVPILRYERIIDLLGDKAADARKNGIAYDTFGLRGTIHGGTLTVTEGVVKSPLMNLAANGDIDMVNDRLDITVLMAPFRTVDAVVRNIPLLGHILGGTLVTVPLRVQGPFKQVKVTALPPSAIGEGLLGIMKRTLDLPFTMLGDIERSAATPSMP